MTKRDLESKIQLVKKFLKQARRYSSITEKLLLANDEKRLAVERSLFLVTQAAIDLAESYCHLKEFQRPASMHEAIVILRDNKVIDDKLCDNLLKMVGFRNVLTHGYSKIDYSKVIQVLNTGLKDIEKLLKAL